MAPKVKKVKKVKKTPKAMKAKNKNKPNKNEMKVSKSKAPTPKRKVTKPITREKFRLKSFIDKCLYHANLVVAPSLKTISLATTHSGHLGQINQFF